MENAFRELIPPVVLKMLGRVLGRQIYSGNFASWEEAKKTSGGYDSITILTKVRDALLKVKSGEAVYERDSVLFDEAQYSWPLLAGLLWIASLHGNRLNLVDFGGSLGSAYYQNRKFLVHLQELQWSIVEQQNFVECGKQYFETEQLNFYHTLDDCFAERNPDTILLGSVLPYLEKPYDLLREVIERGFKYVIFDRTPILEKGADRLTVQKVPDEIYEASYPAWFFNQEKFLNFFEPDYELIADFESADRANIPSTFKGFIFRRR